jgi:hypothetical protein
MSDGQVNLVLGPETHHGAGKNSGMRAMTRTNSGTGPFALILRASNPASVVIGTSDDDMRDAARLRIGLITFSSESEFKTWETKVEAPRLETIPEALDEFIGHLSDLAKKRIAQWK